MPDTIKTLIALDNGIDPELVRSTLPDGHGEIQIAGLVHGLDETWQILQETSTDLLVIADSFAACSKRGPTTWSCFPSRPNAFASRSRKRSPGSWDPRSGQASPSRP